MTDKLLSLAERLDAARTLAKDEGKPAPTMLTDNMVRALDRLFGVDPAKTEEFIRKHPSPFGTGAINSSSEVSNG